jgi:hypothetical protein
VRFSMRHKHFSLTLIFWFRTRAETCFIFVWEKDLYGKLSNPQLTFYVTVTEEMNSYIFEIPERHTDTAVEASQIYSCLSFYADNI